MKRLCITLLAALALSALAACADTACAHKQMSETISPPTCTEEGYTLHTCQRCDYSYKSDVTQPTGHTPSATVVAPTCTEEGYTHYECACGYAYDEDATSPVGHAYTVTVVKPTCTEAGYTLYECKNCDYSTKTSPTEKADHTYTEEKFAATDEKSGYTLYTCIHCGHSYEEDFQENIIPALGQNSANVYLYNNENSRLKILFVGNSIAKHGPKPSVGWTNDCGMAASSIERDYVHLIVKRIMDNYDPNVSFGIAQVAQYEKDFFNQTPADKYAAAREFDADIIIMFFGANVPKTYDTDKYPSKTFARAYEDMRNYLARDDEAIVYHSMGFYIRPVLDAEKITVANQYGEKFIDITDIRDRTDVRGLFNHPNDLGMQLIADRFYEAIEADLKRICEGK